MGANLGVESSSVRRLTIYSVCGINLLLFLFDGGQIGT